MKTFKVASLLVLALVLMAALAACSSPPAPVALSTLPVYAGATATTDANYLKMQDAVTAAFQAGASGQKFGNVETKVYTLPQATKWDDVKKFYDTELAKTGWAGDPKMTFSQGSVQGVGYLRGQQLFLSYLLADPNIPDAVLITGVGTIQ
ncbi:MAG: hypothetical protein WCF84_00380 [Anaerolineae bacterium]